MRYFGFILKTSSEQIKENAKINLREYDYQSPVATNIDSHKNTSGFKGNMVHYIISSRSAEAANDITEILMQRLAEANRLSGRRMEIISEIEPDLYKINNHLEEFIENNYGGVIVIDLSEKFGYDPVDYGMTCKYIEKLVKKYRND